MPTAPGYASVSVQMFHSGSTRPAYITFGVDTARTDPTLVASDVQAAINAAGSLKTIIDSNVTLTQVRASLGTDGTVDNVGQVTFSIAGTNSITSLPPNCALLVHKVTPRGGRRGRGRLFIPWSVAVVSVDEAGIITAAVVTTLNTAVMAFRAALVTNGASMVILHDPGLTPQGAPDLVTSMSVDPLISTQRRRLGR